MAESTGNTKIAYWRRVASIALILLGLAATTAIAATVTQAPTISGTLESGSELTASSGSWTPASATPSYDWLRCDAAGLNCQGITGACGRTYKVRTADENSTLRVRLTAKESSGQEASADSAQTAVIEPKPYLPNVGASDTCIVVKPTGPSQGTFSSGTQISAGSEPPPPAETSLDFIDPFPVIRVAGRFKGKRTTLKRVTVKAPRGARIQARCSGRGCPYRRKAQAVKLVRFRSLQGTYRPKAKIEFRVTQSEKIGKFTRVQTRKGKAPLRIDRCLMPGKTKPVKCPTE